MLQQLTFYQTTQIQKKNGLETTSKLSEPPATLSSAPIFTWFLYIEKYAIGLTIFYSWKTFTFQKQFHSYPFSLHQQFNPFGHSCQRYFASYRPSASGTFFGTHARPIDIISDESIPPPHHRKYLFRKNTWPYESESIVDLRNLI